jgi:sugar-specific transcriptional regulator TrmB
MLSENQTKNKELLKNRLFEFGLSPEQADVYLAGILLGPTSVLNLSKQSDIPRTTVYAVVNELIKKGLFKTNIIGFKKTYEAENPSRLLQTLEQKIDSLRGSIPDFLSLYNLKDSGASIRYYEGLGAIKPLYLESLSDTKPKEDYMVITNPEQWFTIDQKYFTEYKEKRAKLNLKTRMLFQDSETARTHKKYERNFNEEIKILPKNTSINVDFICTPKRVIIFQTQQPYIAIEIENKFVIELYKNLFEIIWNSNP